MYAFALIQSIEAIAHTCGKYADIISDPFSITYYDCVQSVRISLHPVKICIFFVAAY